MSASPPCICSHDDPREQITFDIVNWDALSTLACELYQVKSSHWGAQISGSYNLVRFLHLHDSQNTTLVARVPLRGEEGLGGSVISKRIESEVAAMEYVESYTNIPLPHVCHYSARAEGDVRSPYILMNKAEGTQLCSVWNDMDDDKRRVVMRQVIGILLELWSHRFDKVGAIFKRSGGGEGKDAWYIEPSSVIADPEKAGPHNELLSTSYQHAADYWLAFANAYLRNESDTNIGSPSKAEAYAQGWFMRSLVPALFDPSIDTHGHPLCHGDFHSQNIMITDIDTSPRITAIIDWEFSGPDFVTSFAQYPFFIVDHPFWDEDHPLRKRNVQDQTTFDELLLEEERNRDSVGGLPLSRLISDSYGIYLFQQVMQFPIMYSPLFPLLFKHVFGPEDEESVFPGGYCYAVLENGILRKDRERFDRRREAWVEARQVLGDDKVPRDLKVDKFKDLLLEHLERFSDGGSVHAWLASVT